MAQNIVDTINSILIRLTDLVISLTAFIICLPLYIGYIAFCSVTGSTFSQQYKAHDALHRPLQLTRLNHIAPPLLAILVDVIRGRISFYGIEIVAASKVPGPACQCAAVKTVCKAGVTSLASLHRYTGMVEAQPQDNRLVRPSIRQYVLVITQSILAKLLYSGRRLTRPAKFSLFGFSINNSSMHEAIAWLTAHSTKVEIGFFVNVNSINIGVKNRCFVDTVNRANRVFADGSGVRLGAKYHHIQVRDNINGTDLLPRLCIEASRLNLSLYLLGAAPGIAKLATEKLTAQYPQLNIVGSHHGYFNKGVEESAAVIAAINQSKADIVLIGLGSPLQERWLYRHQHHITASRALAVGGLFDFYSGRLSRAPRWIRALGMEWLWRLWQEPCAKWRRYIIGNPAYLFRLWFSSH